VEAAVRNDRRLAGFAALAIGLVVERVQFRK